MWMKYGPRRRNLFTWRPIVMAAGVMDFAVFVLGDVDKNFHYLRLHK
jgi:hypothetical protein